MFPPFLRIKRVEIELAIVGITLLAQGVLGLLNANDGWQDFTEN